MTTKSIGEGGKSLNLQRRMAIRCIQKKKEIYRQIDTHINKTCLLINLMVTTHTQFFFKKNKLRDIA